MRLFVAIVPPPAATAQLARSVAALRAAPPDDPVPGDAGPAGAAGRGIVPPRLRWAGPDGWHLTLAFLGEVAEPVLPGLTTRLERAARRHPARRLAIAGSGAFPSARRGRVLWAGVREEPGAPPLRALAASVAAGARRGSAPPPGEHQRFRPHLTLARLSQPADLGPLLAALDGLDGPPWTAADIRLIRSHQSDSPGRPPRYEQLGCWPLRAAPAGPG